MRELIAQEEATKFHDDRMQRKATAIDRWHIASSGEGNQAFFQLGVDLRGAGMTLSDIADILQQEAGHAPPFRRASSADQVGPGHAGRIAASIGGLILFQITSKQSATQHGVGEGLKAGFQWRSAEVGCVERNGLLKGDFVSPGRAFLDWTRGAWSLGTLPFRDIAG
jgi:hypothetical protein